MPTPEEPRHHPGVAREYRDGRIVVYWAPQFCIHTANCLNAQPDVFDAMRRPWVVLDTADAGEIAAAVLTCPTGALSFERLDGGAQEPAPEETTVEPRPNGPLYLRGRIRMAAARGTDARGNITRDTTRVALCRCGGSDNKPYCDGTHRANGFRAP
jgi:uncharacterized Fe-S cluster protein YjdI/CDGSH-type Zn-finger protein